MRLLAIASLVIGIAAACSGCPQPEHAAKAKPSPTNQQPCADAEMVCDYEEGVAFDCRCPPQPKGKRK